MEARATSCQWILGQVEEGIFAEFAATATVDETEEKHVRWWRVTQTFQSADGYVRKVKVAVADRELDNSGKKVKPIKFLERPIQKLVLLQETETWGSSPPGALY